MDSDFAMIMIGLDYGVKSRPNQPTFDCSGKRLRDHFARHNRRAFRSAIVHERHVDVIQSQGVQNSGMNIGHVCSLIDASQT